LVRRVDELVAGIRPSLGTEEVRSSLANEADAVKERIRNARNSWRAGFASRNLKPLRFEQGIASLSGWRMVDPPAGGKLEMAKAPRGQARC
jgi:hypothetical protein